MECSTLDEKCYPAQQASMLFIDTYIVLLQQYLTHVALEMSN